MLDWSSSYLLQLSLNVSDKMSANGFIVARDRNDLHHSYAEVVAYGTQRQQQRARHLLIFLSRKIQNRMSSFDSGSSASAYRGPRHGHTAVEGDPGLI